MSERGQTVRWRFVISVVLWLGLLGSWMPLLHNFHWFPALFDHFRLQFVVASGLAMVVALLARAGRTAVFALITLVYHLWPLASVHRTVPSSVTAAPMPALKMVCFNVLVSNTQYDRVSRWLDEVSPDVIILLEVTATWATKLEALKKTHPHGDSFPAGDCTGVAIYSRLPLSGVSLLDHGADTLPSITGILNWAGRPVRLIGVHPIHPTGAKHARMMEWQLEDLARRVSGSRDVPVIVAGDFNCAPWARQMRKFQQGSGLSYRCTQPIWWPTWNLRHPLMLAIDHTLCTPHLFVESREISPDLGSDHRAQNLAVRWVKD
ncbi:MAG: endonuclease/exonuclease/phosphatase family protein [Verrucomicrobiaceae bacterium]|nr:endonuclease/exonuclease/phosphatase family protein [Verrucomicrobiaceae bacterium]